MTTSASLDLKKLPFSRAKSDFFLFEEDNGDGTNFEPGLYFGISYPNGASRREGLVRLVPVKDGEPLDYAYHCSPSRLEMKTAHGSITLVMDGAASLRLYSGSGLGVMISKELPVMSLETVAEIRPGTVEYSLFVPTGGGGRLIFSRVAGEIRVEARSVLTAGGVNRYTIWLLPGEDGRFEIMASPGMPPESEIAHKPLEDCIAEVEAEYGAFLAKFPAVPERWQRLKEVCAYLCWISLRENNRGELVPVMLEDMFCASRLTDMQCHAYQQPFFGLAFGEAEAALGAITNVFSSVKNGMLPATVCSGQLRYGGFPFYHGYALMKALDRFGSGCLSHGKAEALYDAMKANFSWWKESHGFGANRVSYLYAAECGFKGASYGTLEFPLEAPDLYAQMILYAEVIGRVERIARRGNGLGWYAESQALKNTLLNELWDGEAFACRGAISGRRFKSGSLLAYVPIMLGKRLPDDIIGKLERALVCEKRFLSSRGLVSEDMLSAHYDAHVPGCGSVEALPQQLVVGGLTDAGRTGAAVKIAERALAFADENGAVESVPPEGPVPSKKRPADVYEAVAAAALISLAAGLHV